VNESKNAALLVEVSLLLTAVFLGTNMVAVKYAVSYIPPLLVVAIRFALGGLLLWGLLRVLEPESKLQRKDFGAMLGLGVVVVLLSQVAFTFGLGYTGASNTALIYATAPLWGMLLGSMLGLEHPKQRGVMGVGLAIIGVVTIVYGGLGMSETSLPGDLLILGSAACWGFYTALSLPLLRRYSPLAVAAYPMLFGGLAVSVFASLDLASTDLGSVGGEAWLAAIYSTLFATVFAFAAWQRGVSRIGANRVLVYQYLVTLTGVVSGIVLFGEDFGLNKLVGGALLFGGVYLARSQ
jgi:drug/metabolite transporter (DMT)-like permease